MAGDGYGRQLHHGVGRAFGGVPSVLERVQVNGESGREATEIVLLPKIRLHIERTTKVLVLNLMMAKRVRRVVWRLALHIEWRWGDVSRVTRAVFTVWVRDRRRHQYHMILIGCIGASRAWERLRMLTMIILIGRISAGWAWEGLRT